MILTCPDCATRYFLDEAKLGAAGRKVRCASCGASWKAEAETEPLDLTPAVAPPPVPVAVAEAVPRAAEALPMSFRAQQEARRRTRQAVAAGVVWASLVAAFAMLMLAAVVFRVQVVGLWPRTAGAYAALRLPVNPLGLAPEGVQASQGLQDGRAMLFVKGAERNVEAAPRPVAALRVSLYDKAGVRLTSQVVRLASEELKPGEARAFQAAFADPPLEGAQVGVDFAFERQAPVHVAHSQKIATSTPHASLRLRGPVAQTLPPPAQPKLAQPLPAASPYALPAAAQAQADARVG